MRQSLHIKGAHIWDGKKSAERDLFVKDGHIARDKPHDALVIDLEGYTVFPGLINAHDHLELNHYPRTKFRDVYDNAHQWGEDVNARLDDNPFKALRSYPLWDRVFIGGLKNLLCGATTVIHHGPPHKPMFREDFPVRVLKKYGWSHSLHFNTQEEIIRSYNNTPESTPWFIHLAEGTDIVASKEFSQLKALDCLSLNKTVIVHGVNWLQSDGTETDIDWGVRGFVWCPSSNVYLLNKTLDDDFLFCYEHQNAIALGSDSRLTADGDLLDEVRFAMACIDSQSAEKFIFRCLYHDAPFIAFHVSPENWMIEQPTLDFIAINTVTDTSQQLCTATRRDLALVVRDGIPQIGDAELMAKFPHIQTVACTVDGAEKRMHVDLAKQVHRCKLQEIGLQVDDLPSGKRFIFF